MSENGEFLCYFEDVDDGGCGDMYLWSFEDHASTFVASNVVWTTVRSGLSSSVGNNGSFMGVIDPADMFFLRKEGKNAAGEDTYSLYHYDGENTELLAENDHGW